MYKLFSALLFFYATYSISIDINVYDTDKNKVNIFLAEKTENKILLGLEFLLDTDWKVYWKYPGDVGLEPNIQIAEGSRKHKINIKWPYPKELYEEEVNLTSRVYYDYVILPTEIIFFDLSKSKSNKVKFLLDFQICKEICIPVNKSFILDLQPENYINNKNIEKIKTYEAYVPKDIKFSKSLKGNNIRIKKKTVIIELDKKNSKNLLNNKKDNFIFLKNNSLGTTRLSKVEEDKEKIFFFLKDANYDNNITSKSEAFIKINDEYFHWTTSNHIIEKNSLNFNLFLILLISYIGGFILNFMPCVLPVLGLKINSFMQELKSKNSLKIKLGSISIVLGIVSTFLMFSIFASIFRYFGKSVGWAMQFQSPVFILFMMLLLILFILNLLGLFEIRVPRAFNFLLQNKKFKNNSNIYIKNYFTGILSTLLATPCTAPFVGTAISIALTQNFLSSILIFLFMALGKSMPYLIFIIYPQVINFFPKPGRWFVNLKYFFALLLTLTILWLASILFSTKKNINKDWEEFEIQKISDYLANNNSVFVDITAEWCLSCAVNKKLVLDQQDIKALFNSKDIKALRADWTSRDDNILEFLKSYNKYGIPFNILYTPSKPEGFIFSEILTKNQVKKAIENYIDTK